MEPNTGCRKPCHEQRTGLLATESFNKKHPNNLRPELPFVRWIISDPPILKISIDQKLPCSKMANVYLGLTKSVCLAEGRAL